MASKSKAEEEEEVKIPVFTVLKNNTILKNIFIVNKPPSPSASRSSHEDVLMVGRHPDCDLMLTHPSISRFHLQIRSKPSSQSLFVQDLSSVHGTWVSGKKVEAGASVEMKAGDTLKIGVSSRVYRLHWIPINRAYDMENLFLSQLEAVPEEEQPAEQQEEEEEERKQMLKNCIPVEEEEIQSMDSILKCISSLFLDENFEVTKENEILASSPVLEEMKSQCRDEMIGVPSSAVENKLSDSIIEVHSPPNVESVAKCDETWTDYWSESTCMQAVEVVGQGTEMQGFYTPPGKIPSQLASCENQWSCLRFNTDPASFEEECVAEAIVHTESEYECTAKDTGKVTDILSAGVGVCSYDDMCRSVEEVIPYTNCQQIKVEEVGVDSLPDGEKQHPCGEEFSLDEILEDIGNKYTAGICSTSLQLESENSSMASETVLKNMETFGSCKEAMAKKSTNSNIWSRRGKAANAPQIQTSKSASRSKASADEEEDDDDEVFTPDKENFSPNTLQLLCSKKMGMLEEVKPSKSQRSQKDLFSVLDGVKEELFTPDKENLSPNTLRLHHLAKKSILKETKCSKAQCSQNSESLFSANIYPDENITPSSHKENEAPKVAPEHKSRRKPFGSLELAQCSKSSNRKIIAASKKENATPKVSQEPKSRRKPFGNHIELATNTMTLDNRVERVPFQLLMDAGGTTCPVSAAKGIDVSNDGRIFDKHINHSDICWDQKRSWDMVVDTATLMNKESRNALQLLQGLKGTQLIVPRSVIRELDSKKRQYSIFKRISEASLALEWIEECMVKTRGWIHVQSSMEEERLIAPTPPASPQTQFNEESWTFPAAIMEIASPTAEDQILDFALAYKRRQNDGQLVLLSEDVTLKIKSMAEGLLCEPAQEFRASLVNPFSERFLWTNSSPRGQTWSCQDDHVLREKYCRMPVRKSSKGAASGLKLILLHNSQYRK